MTDILGTIIKGLEDREIKDAKVLDLWEGKS